MTWPSLFPFGTQGYMKDRIADELARDGLTTQIAAAISDSITIYQKERFRFNETFETTFTTTVGQQNYTTLGDAQFPNINSFLQFYHIDWVTITIPPAVFDLPRIQPEEILILTQTGTQLGQPYCYAYTNETIMLYPIPSSGGPGQINSFSFTPPSGAGYTTGFYTNNPLTGGHGNSATANIQVVAGAVNSFSLVSPGVNYQVGDVLSSISIGPGGGFTVGVTGTFTGPTGPYLISLGGHIQYQAPTSDAQTGNRWMTDAERLIRSRAKYQIAQHVTRNAPMAMAMSPIEPADGQLPGATYEAWRELRVEGMRMQRRGIIRPMYF
jgi:hypothetical protein